MLIAFGVARRRPNVLLNAAEPGWVATKMGGSGATDDLALGPVTQAWLAVSDEPPARVTGGYFYYQKPRATHPAAHNAQAQDADRLLRGYLGRSASLIAKSARRLAHPPIEFVIG